MRWAIALGGLLVAGLVRAEAPMDLDSPFIQTILIKDRFGEVTEQAVRKGKINGEVIEIEKESGGLLVLPRQQLMALLPRLPRNGEIYLQSDAQRALQVLESAQLRFPQRPEVSAAAIADWRKLASAKTEQDQTQSEALAEWFEKSSRLASDASPDELEKTRQEGNRFLTQFPDRAGEIERELRGLRELGEIDLKKVDTVQFQFGPFGADFLPGAVLWALLILPLVVILKTFADTVRFLQEGNFLHGGLRLLFGGAAVVFLVALFSGDGSGTNQPPMPGNASSMAARKAAWFSLNQQEKWSNQAAKKISLPASDWLAFLEEKIEVSDGSDTFPFWVLAKPRILQNQTQLILFQPVRAKGINLPFYFYFPVPQPGQSFTDLVLNRASLGKIPLGGLVGQFVWALFQPSYQPFVEKCGLQQGVRWLAGEGATVIIQVPKAQKPPPKTKDSLSAQELAEVFEQGFGEIYVGKVITVEGGLVEVSSQRETMGAGTGLAVEDRMDEFTLEGIPEGPGRKYALRIRCQFKSPEAYFLDPKGDLYKSAPKAQNASADVPILRRLSGVTKVRIHAGRVESKSTETRLLTLYDCRKVEGFDGEKWTLIWEN